LFSLKVYIVNMADFLEANWPVTMC